MKKSILILLSLIAFISCNKNDDNSIKHHKEVCDFKSEIMAPEGFDVNTIGSIDFNGSVQSFQFVSKQIGFAMLRNSVGGYVEVFKTIDGGISWTNLNIGIKQHPRGMIFKDENFGIITVLDVTGCPPPNCQNKCVVLKTENGGLDWEEVNYEELKGAFYHPKFDSEGNLYANLNLDSKSVLMKSIDDGQTWDTLFSSPDLGFTLVTFSFEIFQDRIFISAKDGKLIELDKNGNLIKIISINKSPIWDVEIIDTNNIVVVFSGEVLKSTNGGDTWQTIYNESARMIGFDSVNKGLMILQKSSCPTDVFQANDLIASTVNGGLNWQESQETTTNLGTSFRNSQKMDAGIWYIMTGNTLIEIKEK